MSKFEPVLNFFRQMIERLSHISRFIRNLFSNKKRAPELWELEAQFTKDTQSDPERMRNRQLSTTIRSGRG